MDSSPTMKLPYHPLRIVIRCMNELFELEQILHPTLSVFSRLASLVLSAFNLFLNVVQSASHSQISAVKILVSLATIALLRIA